MGNEKLARRYATAVFALAQQPGAVTDVGRDLATISSGIDADETTEAFFLAPIVDRVEKERVLLAAFEGKTNEVALHTLLLLVRKRRESLLRELVEQYRVLERQARGAEPLTVTTAKQMSADELRALVARQERAYGNTVDASQRVDPDLIGGVRVTMGDRRIDGSVAGRLEELTRELFSRN